MNESFQLLNNDWRDISFRMYLRMIKNEYMNDLMKVLVVVKKTESNSIKNVVLLLLSERIGR